MISNSKSTNTAQLLSLSRDSKKPNAVGIVYDVVLDESHPLISNDENNINLVGAVQFRLSRDTSAPDKSLPIAFPFDGSAKDLPLKNEAVEIYEISGIYYYKRISNLLSLNTSADPTTISTIFKPTKEGGDKSTDYRKSQFTGISRSSSQNSVDYDGFGDYYESDISIHRLKLYEGDRLIETRFGQSIRFSGYNNSQRQSSPTIIIRNGENQLSKKREFSQTTEEDVNRDGSIIAMTSNQYQLGFVPGTIADGGGTDFETKPKSFKNYPTRLIGDQLLLNSGRIIISAKQSELIFYSKKNYGFISDGGLSIDNKGGIEANVLDNINITTNNSSINLNTGDGKINLGNGELQPVVKGNDLVDILTEMIDLINKQQFLTPSGPTATGPVNRPQFNSIKSKLKNILSAQNNTV